MDWWFIYEMVNMAGFVIHSVMILIGFILVYKILKQIRDQGNRGLR